MPCIASALPVFAETYEDLVESARLHETLGLVLAGLGFAVIIGGFVVVEIVRRRKRRDSDRK